MANQIVLLSLTVFVTASLGVHLPPEFKICHRSDPNLNECLKEAVTIALPLLKDGVPDLNIRPAEPLLIEAITVKGGGGSVNVDQNYKNVLIHDITKGQVDSAEFSFVDDKDITVTIHGNLEKCLIEADYDFDGKILMLPMKGNGKCRMDLEDTKFTVTMTGEKKAKKGVDHFKLHDVKVDLLPTRAAFNFENLFGGDEALGNQMNKLINEQWRDLFGEVKDGYNDALAAVIKSVSNSIYTKIPYDELFPQ